MKKENFWWNLPAYIDRWRIFPRIFISVYIYLLYQSVTWFMLLDAPTVEQAGLISVIFSVGGFWFNSYLMIPAKKLEQLEEMNPDISDKKLGSIQKHSIQQDHPPQKNVGESYEDQPPQKNAGKSYE